MRIMAGYQILVLRFVRVFVVVVVVVAIGFSLMRVFSYRLVFKLYMLYCMSHLTVVSPLFLLSDFQMLSVWLFSIIFSLFIWVMS